MKDTSWMARAACVGCDPEMFFPVKTGNGARVEAALAIVVCKECPVKRDCLEFARTAAKGYGVWGGSVGGRGGGTGRPPGRPPGRPKRREPWPIKHGTVAGYQQHHKQGVPLCEECVSANKAYRRARRTA